MIKDFTPRLYQETILATAVNNNTLVVLPTGLGKTAIAFLLSAQRLANYPKSKIMLLAPTKPLAQQHLETFKKHLEMDENELILLTGDTAPEKRAELWNKARIVFSTPQGLENDIISSRISLEDVSLVIFDEAHRAVGEYAYGFIANQYYKKSKFPRILGLTASPGADMEVIDMIIKNLHIDSIEIRSYEDPDVKPYVQDIRMDWIKVKLPPIFELIQKHLKCFHKERIKKLKEWGILQRKDVTLVSKTDLLSLQAQLRARISSGEKDFVLWTAISTLAEIMKIQHALELLETQGVVSLHEYFSKLQTESISTKTKAVKNIVKDENFKSAFILAEKIYNEGYQHPKLIELQRIIEKEVKNPEVKIIVFNQYRDNANDITKVLNKIEGVRAQLFVGQMKKGETGLSQKEQKEILEKFRSNEFNILVATSIGEEGLDIPKVDLVIFYEPIPSAIRHIQRRGRTGRQDEGRVIILMTEGTRDEGYRWSAHHKEKQMYRNLDSLRKRIVLVKKEQEKLDSFIKEEKFKVFADHREKSSGALKELVELGADIKLEQLGNADYICSARVGIEIKKVSDFVDSIIDGRLLEQIRNLKNNFERPVVMIEGDEDIYSQRNIHSNAIRGMLATIAVSYGIPIIHTKNPKDSAALIYTIAKREQEEIGKDFSMHASRKPLTLKEQQEYIISALPNVGAKLAKDLLMQFASVKEVMNAPADDLKKIEKIGDKIAKNIRDVLDSKYE